jgi:signal transduction histidine kinase
MQPAALAKDIEVVSFLGPLHSFVSGDATRVQQAVSNLLSNAVKFTPRGGLIAVRLSQHASEAEISVSDSGKGNKR